MNPLSPADTLDLAGPWLLQLDPGDAGIAGRWFARPLAEKINLPGSLPQSGFGHPVAVDTKWTGSIFNRDYFTAPEYEPYRRPGNVKVPFWLQPDTYYVGAAWYQRQVEIPATWTGRR